VPKYRLMNKLFYLFLACLALIIPVTGYVVPHIQTVPGCSGESATTPVGYGEISFASTPSGAFISLDGQSLMQTSHTFLGDIQTSMMTPATTNAAAGSHTVMVYFSDDAGYSVYSSSITVCNQQVTYVTATLVPLPTTIPTTTPTTAATLIFRTVSPTLALPVTTTTSTSTTTATTTSPTSTTTATITQALSTTSQETPLEVTTTIPATVATTLGSSAQSAPQQVTANSGSVNVTATSGLGQNAVGSPTSMVPTASATTKTPGFEVLAAIIAIGAIVVFRKI
jgi:hypothetical protein